jgi:hypothetical protein
MSKTFFATVSFVCLLATPALAKSSCDQIDAAISANEDFVEVALGGDAAALKDAHAAIRTTFDAVKNSLPAAAAGQSLATIDAVDAAVSSGEMSTASIAAIENYAVLAKAFEKRLPTSLEAAMLDYAGFRLHGLGAAKAIDWAKVEATVNDSRANTKAAGIGPDDKALTDLMDNIHAGLAGATASKNAEWLASTAQILLDSVDLVERSVKNGAKEACH